MKNKKYNSINDYLKSIPPKYYCDYGFSNNWNVSKHSVNCSDEICEGSNERINKIRLLMLPTVYDDFTETYSRIIKEMLDLLREEFMILNDWNEHQCNLFIDEYFDFNHVELKEIDGEKFMSVKPKIIKKSERFNFFRD